MKIDPRKILSAAAPIAVAAALIPASATAAVNLAGYYAPVNHEDAGERGPGPDADFRDNLDCSLAFPCSSPSSRGG